ncbi:hypothetical protein [Burkholderia gladioli]|uniref:hypothetical protein n=1 Tax=Burkholderia gladioli TaxID=28095 RepID=UPI0016423122|nr:hypothetical protein [Burkholderia gladioli]
MTVTLPNPLLTDWKEAGEFPPFTKIRPEHFVPAVAQLAKAHLEQIGTIASNTEPATFENTVIAYDATGAHIERIAALFEILRLTVGTDELWAVEAEVSAALAAHHAATRSHGPFFAPRYHLPGTTRARIGGGRETPARTDSCGPCPQRRPFVGAGRPAL